MFKTVFPALLLTAMALPAQVTAQARVSLEGRILDESTGLGIPSVRVELQGQGIRVTADDGTFRFNALAPGTYGLSAVAFGYAPSSQIIELTRDASMSIALERSPIRLDGVVAELLEVKGRVRDPDADFFLVDAEVVTDLGQSAGTDAHGRFRLRGVLRDAPVQLSVRAFGYIPLDTTIVPDEDGQYVFDLGEDPLMRAMVAVQVERLEVRRSPRFAALFRSMDRERILRYAGAHTVLSMLVTEYGHKLGRLGCVVIDERPYERSSGMGPEMGAILSHLLPEEVERIEFMFGGAMARIYTRAFIQEMTAKEIKLRTPQVFPICI
jgi:hypothetical protein